MNNKLLITPVALQSYLACLFAYSFWCSDQQFRSYLVKKNATPTATKKPDTF